MIDQGRSLACFDSALQANRRMFDSLREDGLFDRDEETRTGFREVRERSRESSELSRIFTRIHGDLMEGCTSLVSMNLNASVRTLTGIITALSIPTIIAGLHGMNVPLPFEQRDFAFILLSALVVVIAVTAFLLLRFGERFGIDLVRRS